MATRRAYRNRRVANGHVVAPLNPSQIGNCRLWLRADLGVTIATGVSQWNDQSGNANNATQATTTAQPAQTLNDASYNNQATISFNGTSDFMQCATSPLTQPCTIFFVGNGGGASQGDILIDNGVLEFVFSVSAYVVYAGVSVGTTAIGTGPVILAASCNSGNVTFFIDSSQTVINAGNIGTAGGTSPMNIGASSPNWFNGKIAEVAVFAGALSPLQISSLFKYASARYGIAAS